MISHHNQRGLSSILFAMIFAIILSLLAVGFVTLVRNDQRQTLDQTLGAQAQYAAETAINQVVAGLYADSPIAGEQTSCLNFDVVSGSGVSVPCVTWTDKGNYIKITSLDQKPYVAKIKPASPYVKLRITYSAASSSQTTYSGPFTLAGFPATLLSSNFPVLRFSFMPDGGVNVVQHYIVPLTGGSGSGTYGSSGTTMQANCVSDKCSIDVDMNISGRLALTALGSAANNVFISAIDGVGLPVILLDAQYTIEATAIAQDITKRVEARVPASPQTWRPGFAVSADNFCKDIKMDGDGNSSRASDNSPGSCP